MKYLYRLFPPVILILLSALHLIYALKTGLYFSTDDFAVLAYSSNHSLLNLTLNFLSKGDLFGFRKVLGYIIFKVLFDLFKVNPLPYIFTNHILQTANLILLFLIVKNLTKNTWIAFFCSLLFNKIYLFYFSNIHEYLVCIFCLLTVLFFLKFPKKIYLSLISFILALLTKEAAFSVPFLILALTFVKGANRKHLLKFFLMLLFYGLYQLSFVFRGKILPLNESYQLTFNLKAIIAAFFFYIHPAFLILLAVITLFRKKFSSFLVFASSLLTLAPSLFLINRHEVYYSYLPFAYILIYLATILPKPTFRSSVLYLMVILILGGRSIFPVIAKQNYPNWQKTSIKQVLNRVENSLKHDPKTQIVNIKDLKLERDAALMLGSGTLGLFLPYNLSSKYSFTFIADEKIIKVN